MVTAQFDHFITVLDAPSIDQQLEEYRQAGFLPEERTVRHEPALRNGFIRFGPDYLELAWIEDPVAWADEAAEGRVPNGFEVALRTLRADPAPRPWGIGLISEDVQALHDLWTERGNALPPVVQSVPRDAPPGTPPVWSFQPIPPALLAGAYCFALTYHTLRRDQPRKIRLAPNTTYAIAGVSFVAATPEQRAGSWRDLLAPGATIQQVAGSYELRVGPHRAAWMAPETYQARYGRAWTAARHAFGEIALLHLLAQDLAVAAAMLQRAGRATRRRIDPGTGQDLLLVHPSPRDGVTFAITAQPMTDWQAERTALTGEQFEVEMTP